MEIFIPFWFHSNQFLEHLEQDSPLKTEEILPIKKINQASIDTVEEESDA
ncbi:hypothetical protein BL107_16860 [Synechococcus sp. BL107]|nr:hypothetical protein BL107_16860 [Synechococcus sp. BL107]